MANGDIKGNCLKLLANIKSKVKKIQTEIGKQPRLHKERYLHRTFQGTGLNMFWSTYESFLPPYLIKKEQRERERVN